MRRLVAAFLLVSLARALTLGALGAWTKFQPDLLVAIIAADLDFRKNFVNATRARLGAPIIELEVHEKLKSLRLWIGTGHATQEVGVATALDMMLGRDGQESVLGLVGASTSDVSQAIATIAGVHAIPQISFSATSEVLSNKDTYPFFLRTLPPDSLQALALWNWIRTFQISSATCIYTSDTYGHNLYNTLLSRQRLSDSNALQGLELRHMPQSFDVEEATSVALGVKRMGSRVLLLLLAQSMLNPFVSILKDQGMWGPQWQVVGSDTSASLHASLMRRGFMFFDFVAEGPLYPKFQQLWSQLVVEDIIGLEATSRYQLDRMRMPLKNGSVERLLAQGATGLSSYAGFTFDAYYAYLLAMNRLLHLGVPALEIKGERLLRELLNTSFFGVTGEVSFNQNGDRLSSYVLCNVQWNTSNASLEVQKVARYTIPTEVSAYDSSGIFQVLDPLIQWTDGNWSSFPPESLQDCDEGFFKPEGSGSNRCQRCERGFQCPGGRTFAQLCPRGSYANATGLRSCSLCPAGFYAKELGSTQCSPCYTGTVSRVDGMDRCEDCGIGAYADATGQSECQRCTGGQVTLQNRSTSQDCLCAEGFFMCDETCRPCLPGLNCPAGLGKPEQRKGYWAWSDGCRRHVLGCRSSVECPAGALGRCAEGREGRACNQCKTGHYPQGGECLGCSALDLIPGLLLIVAGLVLLGYLTFKRADTSQESLNLLTAAAVTSQVVMAVQALGSIRELALEWPTPVRFLVDFTRLLTFNFDIVRISCWGSDSPTMKFIGQLLVCPVGCACLFILGFARKFMGRGWSLDATLNHCGGFFFAFFLSITLRNLSPFQCRANPTLVTMVTEPGILCYDSTEHAVLVVLAVLGLAQPIAILCWGAYATIVLPKHIASAGGLTFLRRYRFLFHRFTPDCYFYGLFLLSRNGLIALLPAVFVNLPEVQVPFMGLVLLISMGLQARTFPWRTPEANWAELLLTGSLLLTLLGAAPLLKVNLQVSSTTLGWLLCVPVLSLVLPMLVLPFRPLWTKLLPQQKFLFLCHHKGGAGSLCRLLKILLVRRGIRVFLDCDQLENLDFLFDVVRKSTRCVVVVLTGELLKRYWCAGEIATAFKNQVSTIPLQCSGFPPLEEEALELVLRCWLPEQTQLLAKYGISLEDVRHSYQWLQKSLESIPMPRFGPVWRREAVVVQLLQRCQLTSLSSEQVVEKGKRGESKQRGAEILITSSMRDAEAVSTCEVFQIMLQVQLHMECVVVQHATQMERLKPYASCCVVLLVRGIFQDSFGRSLTVALESPPLQLLTVIADSHFDFDGAAGVSLGSPISVQRSTSEFSVEKSGYEQVFRRLMNVVALPFSPIASDRLQSKQVAEIARRVNRRDREYVEHSLSRLEEADGTESQTTVSL